MSDTLIKLAEPEELRPCPFCGGAAEMGFQMGIEEDPPEMRFMYGVECLSCFAGVWWELTPEAAAQRWNQRDKGDDKGDDKETPRATALKFAYLMGYEDAEAGNMPNTYKAERL